MPRLRSLSRRKASPSPRSSKKTVFPANAQPLLTVPEEPSSSQSRSLFPVACALFAALLVATVFVAFLLLSHGRPKCHSVLHTGSRNRRARGGDGGVDELLAWFEQGGGTSHVGVLEGRCEEDGAMDEGGRSAVALTDLLAGDEILRVPEHVIMTWSKASQSTLGRELASLPANTFALGLPTVQVMVFLLQHAKMGSMSQYAPYVSTLQSTFSSMPMNWTDTLVQRHWRSSVVRLSLMHKHNVDSDLSRLRMLSESFLELQVTANEWLWAFFNVRTRAFVSNSASGERTPNLVPVMDMLNHQTPCPSHWSFDANGDLVLQAVKGIKKSAPVVANYGTKSSFHLLMGYGFVRSETLAGHTLALDAFDIQCTAAIIDLQLTLPQSTAHLVYSILAPGARVSVHLKHRGALTLEAPFAADLSGSAGDSSMHIMAYLRLSVASADELTAAVDTWGSKGAMRTAISHTPWKVLFSATTEVAALREFRELLVATLESYDTSLEEDLARLATTAADHQEEEYMDANHRNALGVVAEEKRAMRYYIKLTRLGEMLLTRGDAHQAHPAFREYLSSLRFLFQ